MRGGGAGDGTEKGGGLQNVSHMAISRTKITRNKNSTVSFRFLTR